jgi:hypothetical protein
MLANATAARVRVNSGVARSGGSLARTHSPAASPSRMLAFISAASRFHWISGVSARSPATARVAAVCQVNDPGISEVTIFNASGGGATSSLLSGLTTADINVEYLNQAGGQVNDLVADYGLIEFVRVQIQGFQHRLIIPLFAGIITLQDFSTTLPRESLGVWPQGFSPC